MKAALDQPPLPFHVLACLKIVPGRGIKIVLARGIWDSFTH
ncbi:hypothetical protein ACF1BQ_031600 [Bradyrhizobium sp. RDT10]